jgi:GDP-L-fucose synthase
MTDFYADKKVVVLGGAGFVGQHLCRALRDCRADVYVIDDFSRHPDQHKIDENNGPITCDIYSTTRLLFHLRRLKPFAVFNLAANVANVQYNQSHHNEMFYSNIRLQTIPVMICEALYSISHYLQVSSACVYNTAPAFEDDVGGIPIGANAGYSWAKRMGERAVQWSTLDHAVIVRPSNIYGPGDWYDDKAHVIPKLIKGYLNGTAKRYDRYTYREFLYVKDAVEGMMYALEHGKHKEVYNLGTGGETAISTIDLHKLIAEITEKPLAELIETDFDPGDEERYSNCDKLIYLGWKYKTSLEDGIKRTVEAYLETR